ncbi:MAG: YcxB family protein [Saprospiraceae bacterium]|nr:YcxB family protein [Saprospiraceae bacterium]
MEPIQVEFTFTPDSFGKAQVYIMFRYLKTGWIKWVILLGVAVWLGSTFYFGGLSFFEIGKTLIWVPLFLALWWVIFRWLSRRNFSKYPMLQHPIRYTFQEENVTLSTHSSESVLLWDTFQKAEETRDFFLLYQNAFMASPLLKTGFQNEPEMERFRQLLHSKHLLKNGDVLLLGNNVGYPPR